MQPFLLGWCDESCHAKDMQSISVARGVMSSWSRRPTTAGLMTRSAMLTLSRWRTSTATSLMPTRLFHKGKMLGSRGILSTNIAGWWRSNVRTPPLHLSYKQKKHLNYHPAFTAAYIQRPHTFWIFLCSSSSRLCRWHFEIQKTMVHINSWQAGIDIYAP